MQKRHLTSVVFSMLGLIIVSFTSVLLSIYAYPTPSGVIQLEFHPSLFSLSVVFLFIFFSCMTFIRIFKEIEESSLGIPRPEAYLKIYSGERLKVIGSHEMPNLSSIYVTIFHFENPQDPKSSLRYPKSIYCFTSHLFTKDDVVRLNYLPQTNQLGYYNDRQMVHMTSF